jgi:hypothetical protein
MGPCFLSHRELQNRPAVHVFFSTRDQLCVALQKVRVHFPEEKGWALVCVPRAGFSLNGIALRSFRVSSSLKTLGQVEGARKSVGKGLP